MLRAQPLLVLEKNMQSCSYGKYASVLEDKSGKLSIRDVVQKAGSFIPCNQDIPNFNISKSAFWLKFRITCKEKDDWRIEAANAGLDHVDCFVMRKDILVSQQVSGVASDDKVNQIVGGHLLFKTFLTPHDTVDIYLRVEAAAPMFFPVKVGSLEAFFNRDHTSNLFHGFYYGIMLMMILYNLFLYVTNRGPVYIYYILYVVFNTLFNAYMLGYIMLFPENIRHLFIRFPTLTPLAFGWFGLSFTIKFLNTKALAPKFHKAIIAFMYLASIPLIISIFGFQHESVLLIQLFGLILVILSLSVGVKVLRSGYRPAKFYVLGFGVYMMSLFMLILANASGFSVMGLENYILEIGSAFEVVMLSFAIGDKLNIANAEKAEAQSNALEALQENERIIKEQNVFLEQKVKERTIELEEQKNLVMEQNKDILDSIRYAKRIQDSLLPNEKFIGRILKGFKNR